MELRTNEWFTLPSYSKKLQLKPEDETLFTEIANQILHCVSTQ